MNRSFFLAAMVTLLPWRLPAIPAESCPGPLELPPDRRVQAKASLAGLLEDQETPPYTKPAGLEFQLLASSLDFIRDYSIAEINHSTLPILVFFTPKIKLVSQLSVHAGPTELWCLIRPNDGVQLSDGPITLWSYTRSTAREAWWI